MDAALLDAVQGKRLIATALDLVSTPSPTGSEQAIGEKLRDTFAAMGLTVAWQEVEDGRPNVIGTLEGAGGGKSLMFNGHMDTSYSGREPWLAGIPGFQPQGFARDGRIYGLGISNMKGALACYVEAVRALQDAGARLEGDVQIAAVCGEIEKTQWGDYRGKEYRGYGTGTHHLVSHGGIADMCILGEPTEQRIVLGHYGAVWIRISTHGPFIHTAFSAGRLHENSIVRMREVLDAVLEWIPSWEERTSYRGERGVVNPGCVNGGFPWRVSRTPGRTDLFLDVRVPPGMSLPTAVAEVRTLVGGLRERFPEYGIESEIFVSVPPAEIAEDHPLVTVVHESHAAVFGEPAARGSERWSADSSVLVQHGIETVNYGVSSGLPDAKLGENLDIAGLVATAKVYALAAARICGTGP